jgi:microcystin-dependent protein
MPDIKEINSGVFLEQPQEKAYNLLPNNSVDVNTLAPDVVALIRLWGVQPGTLTAFAGSVAPTGYLLCDGSTALISLYPELYAAIGSTWNTGGELGTEFRLPNGHGRALIGAGTYTDPVSGSITRTLAGYVGAERHQLTIGEITEHNHGVSDPGHAHSLSLGSTHDNGSYQAPSAVTDNNSRPQAIFSTGNATANISIVNNGGSGTHNNMQPSFVGNWIIKF